MKGDNIAQRLLQFAAAVLRLVRQLPQDPATKHVSHQLVRASTSGGSNFEEARGGESRADFVHKIKVSGKEMRESHYWLSLIDAADLAPGIAVSDLLKEARELVAILAASAKTAANR